MKSKTTTYALMTGVAFIWGVVFYKIFTGLNSEEDSSYVAPTKKTVQKLDTKEEDRFVLLGSYRDPFLGLTSRPQSYMASYSDAQMTRPVKKKAPKPVIEEVKIDWNFIDYIGIVYNKDTKKKVGLLNISGKDYMVNEKDVIEGVTVLIKEKDSIQVEYQSVKKWIRR